MLAGLNLEAKLGPGQVLVAILCPGDWIRLPLLVLLDKYTPTIRWNPFGCQMGAYFSFRS